MNVDIDLSEIDFSNLDLRAYMETGNPKDVRIKERREEYFPKTLELISGRKYIEIPELGIRESSKKLLIAPFVNKCSIIGSSCEINGKIKYTLSHIPPSISHGYYMNLLDERKCDKEKYFAIGNISNEGWKYTRKKKISLTEIKCENEGSKDIILSPLENMLWIVSEEQIFKWKFK